MEKIVITKNELIDKIQDCVDDISIRLEIGKNAEAKGNVAAYSEGFLRLYTTDELVDRLSISLKREIDKIALLDNGKVVLYICENEPVVKKFRDKARYEICSDKAYDALVRQAADKLCITRSDADVLLGGYGAF